MQATAIRQSILDSMIKEIKDVEYPSATMMDRVEAELTTREDLEDYVETLYAKVQDVQYPSVDMINRIEGVLDRLDQLR